MFGGDIEECVNWGTMKGMSQIGGIVGDSDGENGDGSASVIRCTNYGSIIYEMNNETTKFREDQGGVAGCNFVGSIVQDCANFGEVIGGGRYSGGVAGYSAGMVMNSNNNGRISGEDSVGGIVGFLTSNGIIENCTNKGEYIGTSNIGGIVGKNNGKEENVKNCKDEWNS